MSSLPASEQKRRWPAEWEPHAATWIAWPHNLETWPGRFETVPTVFTDLVRTLAENEPVHVLAGSKEVMAHAQTHVGRIRNVTLWDIATNDCWIRDYGPIFVADSVDEREPTLAAIDWGYNAWGGKYPPFDLDQVVSQAICDGIRCPREPVDFILEGGAIEGNGAGLVIVNEACVLHANRNAAATREKFERLCQVHFGAEKVIWLSMGEIAGDDTDGHIDQLVRFVDRDTVVAASCEDRADANFAALDNMHQELQLVAVEHDLEIISLPLPTPKFHGDHRLPASYCNFYIANGVVVVPTFEDPMDTQALRVLAEAFPSRDVIGIDALDLVWGLGAFHCATQQQPSSDALS